MKRALFLVALATFIFFLLYPLIFILQGSFFENHKFSLRAFYVIAETPGIIEAFSHSGMIVICSTLLAIVIGLFVGVMLTTSRFPGKPCFQFLLLAPLVLPPFISAVGIQKLLARFGPINLFLLDSGIISTPIDFRITYPYLGIILLQALHAFPLVSLAVMTTLHNLDRTLFEAARVLGAGTIRTILRILIPLVFPALFASGSLVAIGIFTDLGTPLLFDVRNVVPVKIFESLHEVGENPVAYALVTSVAFFSLTIFAAAHFLSRLNHARGNSRNQSPILEISFSVPLRWFLTVAFSLIFFFALLPHAMVVILSLTKAWFISYLPEEISFEAYGQLFMHPLTSRSILISVALSLAAVIINLFLGITLALFLERSKSRWRSLIDLLVMLPLAIPGIVIAFGFLGAFADTFLDPRKNPLPLLAIGYSIRRLPFLVRNVTSLLQSVSVDFSDAAKVAGASTIQRLRRIDIPLLLPGIVAGGLLVFSFSLIEVSESLVLAFSEQYFPIAKAMYALIGRPDGVPLAAALGVLIMFMTATAFFLAGKLMKRRGVSRIGFSLLVFAIITKSAEAEPTLRILSPHWEGIKSESAAGYNAYRRSQNKPEVLFEWLDVGGGTSDIIRFVSQEFQRNPAGIGVDIMYGGGIEPFEVFREKSFLSPLSLSPGILSEIPSSIHGVPLIAPDQSWAAPMLATFGLLCNDEVLTRMKIKKPRTWSDLTLPEYRSWIGAADPKKSGSLHMAWEILLQGFGWTKGFEQLLAITQNIRSFSSASSVSTMEVASGDIACTFAVDSQAWNQIRLDRKRRITFTVPSEFTLINGDGVAMFRGAPSAPLAEEFISFLLSERGERIMAQRVGTAGGPVEFQVNRMPSRPGLYQKIDGMNDLLLNPFSIPSTMQYDFAKSSQRWGIVNELFRVFLMEKQSPHLHKLAPLFARELREEKIMVLAQSPEWNNPVSRNEILNIWRGLRDRMLQAE